MDLAKVQSDLRTLSSTFQSETAETKAEKKSRVETPRRRYVTRRSGHIESHRSESALSAAAGCPQIASPVSRSHTTSAYICGMCGGILKVCCGCLGRAATTNTRRSRDGFFFIAKRGNAPRVFGRFWKEKPHLSHVALPCRREIQSAKLFALWIKEKDRDSPFVPFPFSFLSKAPILALSSRPPSVASNWSVELMPTLCTEPLCCLPPPTRQYVKIFASRFQSTQRVSKASRVGSPVYVRYVQPRSSSVLKRAAHI